MTIGDGSSKISSWFDIGYKSLTAIAIVLVAALTLFYSNNKQMNDNSSLSEKNRQKLEWMSDYVKGLETEIKRNAENTDKRLDLINDKLTDLRILFAGQNPPRR